MHSLRYPAETDEQFRVRVERSEVIARVLVEACLANHQIQEMLCDRKIELRDCQVSPTVRIEFEQAIAIGGLGETLEVTKSKSWGDGPYVLPLEPDDTFFEGRITCIFKENSLYNRRFEQRKRLKELLGIHRPLVEHAKSKYTTKALFLKHLLEGHGGAPLRVTEDGIEIYEEPDSSKNYVIGVDTAEGLADGDNSVISVVCKETGHEVGHLAGKISAIDEDALARMVAVVARMYENHLCILERNNHGHTVIAFLKSDGAVNLYRQEDVDSITGKTSETIGWNMNQQSKAFAIDTLKKDLKQGTCVPHSFETYDELRTFVHGERGKMGGIKGHKDDRVIGLALANMAAQQAGMGKSCSADPPGTQKQWARATARESGISRHDYFQWRRGTC